MRYKFRAYHKKKERLVDVLGIDFENSTVTLTIETDDTDSYWWHNTTWNLDEVELMQFTGLTDKNGKEIYEGDIVSIKDFSFSNTHQPVELIRTVGTNYGAYVLSEKGMLDVPMTAVSTDNIEVIGNVHQHRHLLKENEK